MVASLPKFYTVPLTLSISESHMALKSLPLETWGDYTPPAASVRIKRQSDRKFYDSADGVFKPESLCKSPWVPLSASNSPNAPNVVEAFVDLDPKQWTDGDYTVYFHDTSTPINKLFNVTEVAIFDGDATTRRCPSITEIAGRVLDCTVASHTGKGTVGAWMIDTTARLQAIQDKLTK